MRWGILAGIIATPAVVTKICQIDYAIVRKGSSQFYCLENRANVFAISASVANI